MLHDHTRDDLEAENILKILAEKTHDIRCIEILANCRKAWMSGYWWSFGRFDLPPDLTKALKIRAQLHSTAARHKGWKDSLAPELRVVRRGTKIVRIPEEPSKAFWRRARDRIKSVAAQELAQATYWTGKSKWSTHTVVWSATSGALTGLMTLRAHQGEIIAALNPLRWWHLHRLGASLVNGFFIYDYTVDRGDRIEARTVLPATRMVAAQHKRVTRHYLQPVDCLLVRTDTSWNIFIDGEAADKPYAVRGKDDEKVGPNPVTSVLEVTSA